MLFKVGAGAALRRVIAHSRTIGTARTWPGDATEMSSSYNGGNDEQMDEEESNGRWGRTFLYSTASLQEIPIGGWDNLPEK